MGRTLFHFSSRNQNTTDMTKGSKPNMRKKILENLLNLYDFLLSNIEESEPKWVEMTITQIKETFHVSSHYLAILVEQKILIRQRITPPSLTDRKYGYKWIGIRPSIHMVNAICDAHMEKIEKRPSNREEETIVASIPQYNKEDQAFKSIPLALVKEENGWLTCKFPRKLAHILLSTEGKEILLP